MVGQLEPTRILYSALDCLKRFPCYNWLQCVDQAQLLRRERNENFQLSSGLVWSGLVLVVSMNHRLQHYKANLFIYFIGVVFGPLDTLVSTYSPLPSSHLSEHLYNPEVLLELDLILSSWHYLNFPP